MRIESYLIDVGVESCNTGVGGEDDEGNFRHDSCSQNHDEQKTIHEHLDEFENFQAGLTVTLTFSGNSLEDIPGRPTKGSISNYCTMLGKKARLPQVKGQVQFEVRFCGTVIIIASLANDLQNSCSQLGTR